MPCQILVENRVGTKGAISVIAPATHVWTHNETLSSWLIRFPNRDITEYHRNYSLVIVTDRDLSELSYLTAPIIINDDPVGVAWRFIEPDSTSPEWQELFTTGQTTKTLSEISHYLVENN